MDRRSGEKYVVAGCGGDGVHITTLSGSTFLSGVFFGGSLPLDSHPEVGSETRLQRKKIKRIRHECAAWRVSMEKTKGKANKNI